MNPNVFTLVRSSNKSLSLYLSPKELKQDDFLSAGALIGRICVFVWMVCADPVFIHEGFGSSFVQKPKREVLLKTVIKPSAVRLKVVLFPLLLLIVILISPY